MLRRSLSALVALLGVVILVFVVVRVVPGDPVDHLLGEQATATDRAALRERMHLDGSLPDQLATYLTELAQGGLGTSYALRGAETPVATLIAAELPHTVGLALASLMIAIALALPLGLGAALRRDGALDHGARAVALLAVSTPAFVSGPALIYVLAVWLPLAPTPAHDATPIAALVLPSLIVGFALSGRLARLLRATVLETLRAPWVEAARARGLSPTRVVLGHVLPNAVPPVLTVLGLQLAALLGGALVTEKVFGRPGIGTLLLDAISCRDYAVVQGCVIVIGLAYTVINGAVDVAHRSLDPRIRDGHRDVS